MSDVDLSVALAKHLEHWEKDPQYKKRWGDPEQITVKQLQVIQKRLKQKKCHELFQGIKEPVERSMVTNPDTGRKVVVGSRVYQKLVKDGKIVPKSGLKVLVSIGVQTEIQQDVQIKPRQTHVLPAGKMSLREREELVRDVDRLLKELEKFKKVDPRQCSPGQQMYLINIIDVCVYYASKNQCSFVALCGSSLGTERIFTWLKSLRNCSAVVNRCKRYLEWVEGRWQTTEVNWERKKIPQRKLKILKRRIKSC